MACPNAENIEPKQDVDLFSAIDMIKKLVRDKKCARNDTPSPETIPSFEGCFLA